MSNKTENASIVTQEEARKSVLRRTYISVEKPEVKNGQDLQDIDFSITNLDGKAYHRNETIVNSVRGSCKHCFQEFSLELEFLEHLQRSFKCVIYDTQCVVCKRYFNGDRGLNQHLICSQCPGIMLKQDPNVVLPDHCLPNKGSNPVLQTSPDNHHSAMSRNGKEEERVNLGKWIKKDPIR